MRMGERDGNVGLRGAAHEATLQYPRTPGVIQFFGRGLARGQSTRDASRRVP